eukprot:scaffold12515_cov56-Phaeocystis_antarctica.AAC.3
MSWALHINSFGLASRHELQKLRQRARARRRVTAQVGDVVVLLEQEAQLRALVGERAQELLLLAVLVGARALPKARRTRVCEKVGAAWGLLVSPGFEPCRTGVCGSSRLSLYRTSS